MSFEMPKNLEEFIHSKLYTEWLYSHSYKDIHRCFLCPLIQDELNDMYEKNKNEPVAYTEVQNYIEDLREMCDYCWCPHAGGKLWWNNHSENWKCIYDR